MSCSNTNKNPDIILHHFILTFKSLQHIPKNAMHLRDVKIQFSKRLPLIGDALDQILCFTGWKFSALELTDILSELNLCKSFTPSVELFGCLYIST